MRQTLFHTPTAYSVLRLNLSRIIATTADNLKPCLVSSLMLAYAQHVLVQGSSFHSFAHQILPTVESLRQMDILHVFFEKGMPQCLRYTWQHSLIRPWGHLLPVQCEGCGRIRSWLSVRTTEPAILFACRGCEKKLKFLRPEKFKWLGLESNGGRWMVIDETN